MRFSDRDEAGRRLGRRLAVMALADPVVYALPRGGVPVAVQVARALGAPVDLILVRKIGAPGSPELALGAVVDGEDPQMIVNEDVAQITGADAAFLEAARTRELEEIDRRRKLYLSGHARISPAGRTAIVVDDGLATGASARVAVRALKAQGARRVVVAVPVAPMEVAESMRQEADEVVCLNPAERFWGVGGFYDDFHQLTDEEVVRLLKAAWTPAGPVGPAAGGPADH